MHASEIDFIPLSCLPFNGIFKFVLGFGLRKCVKVIVEQRKNNAIIIHYIFLLTSSNFSAEAKYENLSKKILKLCRTMMKKNELHFVCRNICNHTGIP